MKIRITSFTKFKDKNSNVNNSNQVTGTSHEKQLIFFQKKLI